MELIDWDKILALVVVGGFLGLVAYGTVETAHFLEVLAIVLGLLFGIGVTMLGGRLLKTRHFVPPVTEQLLVFGVFAILFVANAIGVFDSQMLVALTLTIFGYVFGRAASLKG